MNRMISLARVMFAGLGLYLLTELSRGILMSISYAFIHLNTNFDWESVGTVSLSLLIMLTMTTAIIVFLFVKNETTARKLIGKDINGDEPLNINITLNMAFRIVCVGAGLFFLRSFALTTCTTINKLLLIKKLSDQANTMTQMSVTSLNMDLVQSVLMLTLAIYLICGAPHFVDWQVKKTLKLCAKK